MPRVFIRHKTGSKAHQTGIFDFIASHEVLIGRDQSCGLAYDENLDEMLSRQHAKIVQNPVDTSLFTIENLGGNGTFVNGQRIATPIALHHGDLVKFGQSGPSFVFEIDPPPSSAGPKLTVADFEDAGPARPRAVIKHQTGSKAGKTESLQFTPSGEALIGRSKACALAYDDTLDKTVHRMHAMIRQNPKDPSLFMIENIGENGTFVDGRKIASPTVLRHKSVVKLGPSGPSFVFEIDPPPTNVTVFDGDEPSSKPNDAGVKPWWENEDEPWYKRTQHEDPENSGYRQNGRKYFFRASLIFVLVLLISALALPAYVYFARPKDSDAILRANGPSVVSIDVTWRLFDPMSGRQAYHWYVPDPAEKLPPGHTTNPVNVTRLPVFIRLADGGVEPVLILDDERDTNKAIAGHGSGSGCVVRENGFILTSSLVTAPFDSAYDWTHETVPALLVDPATHSVARINEFPSGWVPSSARYVINRRTTLDEVRLGQIESTGGRLQGRLDAIAIGFTGTGNHLNATLAGTSANNLISLVKADPIQPLHTVAISAAKTHLAVAQRSYVFGYSLVPDAQHKASIRLASVVKVGDATSGGGMLPCPGCYQVSESGADAGFNGGPVFDDHGRLAGVFLAQPGANQNLFSVVPVDQSADLLGISKK